MSSRQRFCGRLRKGCAVLLLSVPVLAAPTDRLANSFDLLVPLAPRPVASEGRVRIFYELHLRNFADTALAPERVAVIDASNGRELETYSPQKLKKQLAVLPSSQHPTQWRMELAPGTSAVVYVELSLAPTLVPEALSHRVEYRVDSPEGGRASTRGGAVRISAAAEAPLGPPLRGGPWAAAFHPAWERGHRRVFYTVEGRARIPGRFALDLVKIGSDGRLAEGDPDLVRNSYAYGNDVLAVADAIVVDTRNDYPEVARLSENGRHPMRDGSGNYVVLDIGQGRYAFYEHLRPGSVRVSPGQHVGKGAVLAQVGFSGTGIWPHLHFHVADAPSLLGAEGLPFEFAEFRKAGSFPDIADLGKARWAIDASVGIRKRERPADNSVVFFSER